MSRRVFHLVLLSLFASAAHADPPTDGPAREPVPEAQVRQPDPPTDRKLIVYVVDASGSMLPYLPFALDELKRSVNELSDALDICILFYQDGKVLHAVQREPMPITGQNRLQIRKWIDGGHVVPQGGSDPRRALRKAFAYKPDIIFVLSHDLCGSGRFATNPDRVLRTVRRQHRRKPIEINCIQFEDSRNAEVFEKIAEATGGRYIFVSPRMLALETQSNPSDDD